MIQAVLSRGKKRVKVMMFFLAIIYSGTSYAQYEALPVDEYGDEASDTMDVEAHFPGGYRAQQKFIQDNIHYPIQAQDSMQQGVVYVRFTVAQDGAISNTTIARGVSYSIDRECIRLVEKMPNFVPGRQAGEVVRMKCTLPIRFTLQ
jgi:protein TonB